MQPANTILGPSGVPVWSGDEAGNTVQVGTATVLDLVLTAEPAPVPPAPGYLRLYSPDGEALALLDPANVSEPVSLGKSYATVAGAGATVTGVTAETLLASGITVPSGGLAQGQVYRVVAQGTLTTTVDTQTVVLRLRYGGLTGVDVLDFGTQNPNNSATVTGGRWRAEYDIIMTTATTMSVSGWDGLNFFFSAMNGGESTVPATGGQFVLTAQPSATAFSMTCTSFACERVA